MSSFPITRVLAVLSLLSCLSGSPVPAQESDAQKGNANGAEPTVYEAGGEVKPPKLIHYVEPAFSPKSKEAYVEGVVRISTVVTTEGTTTKIRVLKGLNADEDRTAMDAVQQWKFEPGTRNGQPVNVRVTVEISFHLL